jgi:predicted permease
VAALTGYLTIGLLIGLGWLLARIGLLTVEYRRLMSSLAFNVATPALLYSMMAAADLDQVFARSVPVSYAAIAGAGLVYLAASRLWRGHDLADRTIGTLLACYTNAGNLGLPVAAYVLGDITWMAPILLIQVGFLQPVALVLLDFATSARRGQPTSSWRLISLPLRNPMTVGVLLGLAVNLAGWTLPVPLADPVDLVAGLAVPLMLLAFGVSLRLEPRPAGGAERTESWFLVLVKTMVQPAIAFALASLCGLDPATRRAVTVLACLPSAQHIFIIASRYGVRLAFARDTIFRGTVVSAVVVLAVSLVLG